MSGKDTSSLNTDEPSNSSTGERGTKKQKIAGFPGRHANGAAYVYRKDLCYRDNSLVLETLFNNKHNALCFTRPMQLGKSILFSLANELYSKNQASNVDSDLNYSPSEDDRNKWYVLRLNFGTVVSHHYPGDDWEMQCRKLDERTSCVIKMSVVHLLNKRGNEELLQQFRILSEEKKMADLYMPDVITFLTLAIQEVCGRLLILVDEYDQPIREGLLSLIPQHGAGLYTTVQSKISKFWYPSYFRFFRAVKAAMDTGNIALKLWLTGITPIGIKEMCGLNVVHLTFKDSLANAVGLTAGDIERMLDRVDDVVPFQEGEREKTMNFLREQYNNLRFPGGEPLYHTALVNGIMEELMTENSQCRRDFLKSGQLPVGLSIEPVSSVIFDVLCNARNLRPVVNKLVDGEQVDGYKLNYDLSLEHLLQPTISISDYLTLLVHVGVVSVTTTTTDVRSNVAFRVTTDYYRSNLLKPILITLRASLEKLVSYTSAQDLYRDGEDVLQDFVTSISKNNMARLMAWACSDPDNHILEIQFQTHVVTEAHDVLAGVAQTTQEDILPLTGKRTDVTFSSPTCVVVLDLKQVPNGDPTSDFIANAHRQLAGYVDVWLQMESAGRKRPVAGFVVIMYNDGASYVVEKLRESG